MLEHKRKVPTLLGLVVLLLGIGGGIFFAEYSLDFFSTGKINSEPVNIRVSNTTDSLASISWLTEAATEGNVKYGLFDKTIGNTAHDDRVSNTNLDKYTLHHVTIRGLDPESRYQFVITADGKEYNDDGKPYEFETFAVATLSKLGPATGEVKLVNGQPATGSIVFSQISGATLLSTLVGLDGSWVQPLNIAYDTASKQPVLDNEAKTLNLYVLSQDGKESQVLTDTDHDFPAPAIVIGQRYNFLTQKTSAVETAVLGDSTTDQASGFAILQPTDNQAVVSVRPLIRGKGKPGQKVTVIVESKPQAAVVSVDERGDWQWTPFRELVAGLHTVTVKTVGADGENISEARRFIVLKSGSQVLAESTPSASLTPSPSVVPTVISTPTPIFSSPTPATTEGTPISGNATYTLVLVGLGFGLLLVGFFPKLLLRK